MTDSARRALLLGEGLSDRKPWIEDRLQESSGFFSIAVDGSAVLDNHLLVLLRLDPDDTGGVESAGRLRRIRPGGLLFFEPSGLQRTPARRRPPTESARPASLLASG